MPPPNRTTAVDYHYYAYDNSQASPWTLGPAQPSRDGLQFYGMHQDLLALHAYGKHLGVPNIELQSVGASITDDGATRYTLVLSFGGTAMNAPGVLFTGGIHAREWLAPAIAYLLAEYLVMNYRAVPATANQTALANLVNSRRIYIAPMANPHGNMHSVYSIQAEARLWRRNRRPLPTTSAGWQAALTNNALHNPLPNPPFCNVLAPAPPPRPLNLATYDSPIYRRAAQETYLIPDPSAPVGVDINRNFDTTNWGKGCPDASGNITNGKPDKDDYFGPNHSSEIETRNLACLLADVARAGGGLCAAIDYHSYGKYILYPTEPSDAPGGRDTNYTQLGRVLQKLIGPRREGFFSWDYTLGTPREAIGYDAVGTLVDRAAMSHLARAFVVELDGTDFSFPENQIMGVFEKNLRGALALISAAGHASSVTDTDHWYGSRRTINLGELQFLDWDCFNRGNQLPL